MGQKKAQTNTPNERICIRFRKISHHRMSIYGFLAIFPPTNATSSHLERLPI
jgi:hypothetical protein